MPINPQWLDLVQEEVLEPDLAICDPHHHLWDYPESRYLLDELLADTSDHNVRSTVFVECMSMYRQRADAAMAPVGETEFVQGIAAQSASGQYGEMLAAAAIISYADLRLGKAVEEVLDAHSAASPNRFRGVRHACSWDASDLIRNSHTKPPPDLYMDNTFREGLAVVAEKGLVFDSWLYHTQLHELLSLAQAFPQLTIVLDHIGGPLGIGPYAGKQDAVVAHWQQGITQLAQCPNMLIKLGGMGMPINGFDWHKRETPPTSAELAAVNKPYLHYCIEAFGVDRCMFESNFPVDKVSSSYTVLWNAFKRVAQGFSSGEKAKLFHDNAVRVYSIDYD